MSSQGLSIFGVLKAFFYIIQWVSDLFIPVKVFVQIF